MTTVRTKPPTIELSDPEKRCLGAFRKVSKRMKPISPSLQEIADELGVTKATAAFHFKNLEAKGFVTRDGRRSRTLRLARRTA